jgi:hypothetical protein
VRVNSIPPSLFICTERAVFFFAPVRAVVVQPFATQAHIDWMPTSFVSDEDCFHPSLLAHQLLAVSLWCVAGRRQRGESVRFS